MVGGDQWMTSEFSNNKIERERAEESSDGKTRQLCYVNILTEDQLRVVIVS